MSVTVTLFAAFVIAAPALAQADFEVQPGGCSAAIPVGKGMPGDPEGVSRDTNPGVVSIDSVANGCGFPVSGAQYLRVQGEAGDFMGAGELLTPGVPPGPGNPLSGTQTEAYIPVPAGAAAVGFFWDFYTVEMPMAGFNDGMLVDVIDSACNQLSVLAFMDTDGFNPGGAACIDLGMCAAIGLETTSPGAETVTATLPAGAAFIRVAVWNGTDNGAPGDGVIDGVTFAGAPSYPGTGEDLESIISLNLAPPVIVLGGTDVVAVAAGDLVTFGHVSPGGSLVGVGDLVSIGSTLPTTTPMVPPFPGLFVNPATAFLVNGTVAGVAQTLPPTGFVFSFFYSGGPLAGLSLYLQGIVATGAAANGIFASSNTAELQLM